MAELGVMESDNPAEASDEQLNEALGLEKIGEVLPEPDVPDQEAEVEETTAEAETAESEPTEQDALKEQIEKLNKSYENAQQLIARQGNELGELRKLRDEPQPEPTVDEDLEAFAKNPREFAKQTYQQELQAEKARREQERVMVEANRQFINQRIPNFSEMMGDIREDFKSEGASDEALVNLENELIGNPTTAIYVAKAIQAQKEATDLKAQLEEARKKPNEFLAKIQAASRKSPSLSSKVGTSSKAKPTKLNNGDITSLSDEDLDKLISESA